MCTIAVDTRCVIAITVGPFGTASSPSMQTRLFPTRHRPAIAPFVTIVLFMHRLPALPSDTYSPPPFCDQPQAGKPLAGLSQLE